MYSSTRTRFQPSVRAHGAMVDDRRLVNTIFFRMRFSSMTLEGLLKQLKECTVGSLRIPRHLRVCIEGSKLDTMLMLLVRILRMRMLLPRMALRMAPRTTDKHLAYMKLQLKVSDRPSAGPSLNTELWRTGGAANLRFQSFVRAHGAVVNDRLLKSTVLFRMRLSGMTFVGLLKQLKECTVGAFRIPKHLTRLY